MAEPRAGAPHGRVELQNAASQLAEWSSGHARWAGAETQAASRVAVHGGTLPGAQAVPAADARNIAEAMSYGAGFGPHPLTKYAWQKVNCALFHFGAICRLDSDQRHYKLQSVSQNIQGGSFLSPCQHISFNCLRSHVRLRSLSSKIISFLCSLMTGPLVKTSSPPCLPTKDLICLGQAGCFAIKVCNLTIGREIN